MPEPDTPISSRKLIEYLKSSRVNLEGANEQMYLYGTGRNILADLVLIGIVTGQFEMDEKKAGRR